MAKPQQGMLADNISTTLASIGAVGSLSTSDSTRLSKAYPDSPSLGGSASVSGMAGPNALILLKKKDYRDWYTKNVISFRGHSNELAETVSLKYQDAPDLSNLPGPELEETPGSNGSTIIAAGIGPNVNVRTLDKYKNLIMVDPTFIDNLGIPMSSPPFTGNGSASPSNKISKVTLGDLILGVSPASSGRNP